MNHLEFNETFYGTLNAQVRESRDAEDITPVTGPKFSELSPKIKQKPIIEKINLGNIVGDFKANFQASQKSCTTPKVGGKTQPIWLDLNNQNTRSQPKKSLDPILEKAILDLMESQSAQVILNKIWKLGLNEVPNSQHEQATIPVVLLCSQLFAKLITCITFAAFNKLPSLIPAYLKTQNCPKSQEFHNIGHMKQILFRDIFGPNLIDCSGQVDDHLRAIYNLIQDSSQSKPRLQDFNILAKDLPKQTFEKVMSYHNTLSKRDKNYKETESQKVTLEFDSKHKVAKKFKRRKIKKGLTSPKPVNQSRIFSTFQAKNRTISSVIWTKDEVPQIGKQTLTTVRKQYNM